MWYNKNVILFVNYETILLKKGEFLMKFKKFIAFSASLSAAITLLCNQTALASNNSYTSQSLKRLGDVVLGNAAAEASDDLNNDGSIDSFDLCLMRREVAAHVGEEVTASYPAEDTYVKLVGRNMVSSGVTWLVQSGSAVEFKVTGKSASVDLVGDSSINNDADYRSRYAVIVDGEIIADNVMNEREENVVLFEGDVQRTADVKIIHLSEANNGAVGVKNITVTSSALSPIVPLPKKELSIEFIGDSITCAYGVEGKSSYESFKTTTENFMKSYAYLTAQKLDAEYSAVSYSGHGIISGYTNDGEKNTDSLVPDCYGLVGKLDDYAVSWDFSQQNHDVVVINLGTNDSSYVSSDVEQRGPEFLDGYVNFLNVVREKNPESYIICTLGTMGGEEVYDIIEQAVENYKSESGDQRVMSYKSAVQNPADGIGSDWHPSEITQQNSAYVLADKICQALGMESDQIGLDVAADAEYSLNIDPDKGGNAAHYIGYDKSFWINMVTGGSSPDAIEALISGINLKSGGSYRLEFDCTSAAEREMPIEIRSQSDNSLVLFSDSVDARSDEFHYSKEVTIDNNCDDAEIVFGLGGNDYYNVTLKNIKLVKIG